MQKSDRIKRAIAFYVSVVLFFITLPIVLSYSLGYKIDFIALKIYKTGILYINSRPSGASIYIDGNKFRDVTPAQIENMRPGTYKVEVRRQGFYPWEKDLEVLPNMVTRADKIILFPVTQEMNRVSDYPITDFMISEKSGIYYLTRDGLFRSNFDGGAFKRLSAYSDWPSQIMGKKISPDNNKFLYFTKTNIFIAYLNPDNSIAEEPELARIEEIFVSRSRIVDVFWYSDSGYIIVVTEREIKAVELRGGKSRNVVTLFKFNSKPKGLYYDEYNDSIYFSDNSVMDIPSGAAPSSENYLYRLDLRQKFLDSLKQLLMKKETGDIDEG